MPAPNAASKLKKVRDILAFLLNVSCRLFDLLLWDAVGRGNLAFRDNLGVAPPSDPERQRDQQEKDDHRGPLGLLESPVEGEELDDDIRAYKEDQKLGDGITKQIGDHEHARATIASGQEKEHYASSTEPWKGVARLVAQGDWGELYDLSDVTGDR